MSAAHNGVSPPAAAMRRLFFAVWPSADARTALRSAFGGLVTASRGRAVPAANLHLTLEFLGAVAEERLADLRSLGAGLKPPPRAVVLLDRAAWWPRARTLVAEPSAPADTLAHLQAELRKQLGARDFRVEARAFRPHVTLARKVAAAPAGGPSAPVAWPLSEIALVESVAGATGSLYTPLARWAASG